MEHAQFQSLNPNQRGKNSRVYPELVKTSKVSEQEATYYAALELVERIAAEINIPFTVGGGINSIEDVSAIIKAGADKVTINSSAVKKPDLISDISEFCFALSKRGFTSSL